MDEKIDIHNSKNALKSTYARLDKSEINEHNKAAIKEFLTIAEGGFFGRGAGTRKICKYIDTLLNVNRQLGNRPFKHIPKEDYLQWYMGLRRGEILSKRGTPYAAWSYRDIIKDFKTFLSWYDDGKHHHKVKWFKAIKGKQDKSKLSMDIIRDMVLPAVKDDVLLSFYIAIVMDSGARPEELWNCRREDFRWVENNGKACYWLNIRHSKNEQQPRDNPCPNFTEIYNEYEKAYGKFIKEGEQIIPRVYLVMQRKLRKVGQRLGKKVLRHTKRGSLTHYELRRASWTYWGTKIRDKYALNKRMGEKLTSDMADVYMDDGQVNGGEEAIIVARQDEVIKLQKEVAVLRKQLENQAEQAVPLAEFLQAPEMQRLFKAVYKLQRKVEGG